MRFLAILFVFANTLLLATSWQVCSEEQGGGICPDNTTCCPSGKAGESHCIPLVAKAGQPNGLCCGDSSGCRHGYKCAVKSLRALKESSADDRRYCKATDEVMALDPSAKDTPRYDLCRIREDFTKVYGFPVSPNPENERHMVPTTAKENINDNNNSLFHLAYFSSVGPIAASWSQDSIDTPNDDRLEGIEHAIIVIHGSLRDAEDYFCAGLSLMEENDNSTMVLAPKFASLHDTIDSNQFLVWEDQQYAYDDFLWHIWRYGADAANAPISSYQALDAIVEHLDRLPNLQQITVVGHSAGGQMLQRWALLSNSPAWNSTRTKIRVVAANPRSYAYLDGRRWFATGAKSDLVFRLPNDDDHCPWYNHWLWGLEDGGDVLCPYRDTAVELAGSLAAIGERYASRDVVYLSGEYDTIPQSDDRCGNALQGEHRHERAIRFYRGLQEYFVKNTTNLVHTFFTIPQSNHDHALMFQSPVGKNVILGGPSTMALAPATTIG